MTGQGTGLKRDALGTGGIVFLVVSAAAPLTVMVGVAPLAIMLGGIGAPVGYLVAGAVLCVFAAAFLPMARQVADAGAFYSYVSRGLGRSTGVAAGMSALVAYNALQIGVFGLFATQAQATLRDLFGWEVPWPLIAAVAVLAVFALGYRGIDVGAKVLGVLLVAETGLLVVLAVAVVVGGGADGLGAGSFTPQAVSTPGMAGALAICFAAFMGFESTVLYREEARNPQRTIPRATYLAVTFMAVLYAFIVWAVVQAFGESEVVNLAGAHTADLFFLATDRYLGPWASILMRILIITSVYATQLAFHNAVNRYVYSLSRDQVLPRSLGRLHPRHRSPYRAGLLQCALALVVVLVFAAAGADPYRHLLLWVNTPGVIGVLGLQVLVAVSAGVFVASGRAGRRSPAVLATAVLAAALLTTALVLVIAHVDVLTAAGPATNTLLVCVMPVVFLSGLGLAALSTRRRARTSPSPKTS
ncbi:APC family permease [Amycolatopsis nigrescens]|uniref:APC family permease n=1 Tax=Amycolatopsis nigrescens TaxID=381445 RepID=UPI00035FE2B3|nr:APC family permease [Amycolatopsis nigrescens]